MLYSRFSFGDKPTLPWSKIFEGFWDPESYLFVGVPSTIDHTYQALIKGVQPNIQFKDFVRACQYGFGPLSNAILDAEFSNPNKYRTTQTWYWDAVRHIASQTPKNPQHIEILKCRMNDFPLSPKVRESPANNPGLYRFLFEQGILNPIFLHVPLPIVIFLLISCSDLQ